MTPTEATVLGLIQGVTEFLPISSSAHLILVPYILGWQDHDLRFDVVTNAGTLLAAVVYFRRDLGAAVRKLWHQASTGFPESSAPGLGLIQAILLSSAPVLIVGFLFYDWFATAAREPRLIAISSIAFGVLLYWADRRAQAHGRRLREISWIDCAAIGLCQTLALIPGTSRSGITITGGLVRGFGRTEAARFSLLLAIPVGTLALVNDFLAAARGELEGGELWPLLIGFVTSATSAYLVIGWLLAWLQRQSMTLFVVYRVALGLLILVVVSLR